MGGISIYLYFNRESEIFASIFVFQKRTNQAEGQKVTD